MNRSFEMLESRTLLSSAALTDGTLLITGDNGVTNQISVALNADGLNLDVSMATNSGTPTVQQFAIASVKDIVVVGGNMADTLTAAADLNISVKMFGADGDDIITGGAANDLLKGGKGNDQLNGGAGNDKLMGGKGDDILVGSDGNDKLWGNQGNDNLDGGLGNDRLDGGKGTNILTGGDGDDKLFVIKTDTFDAGLGNNKVHTRGKHGSHAH
jgi:Ca2+-binding RTX toxin-like protein